MAAIGEGSIESVSGLLDKIDGIRQEAIKDRDEDVTKAGRRRFWYRGEEKQDPEWTLIPKGLRKSLVPGITKLRNMVAEFQAEATSMLSTPPDQKDCQQWLFWMQHHGFPTLLLDWTRSPLAALYFALENSTSADKPGTLWALRPGVWNSHFLPRKKPKGKKPKGKKAKGKKVYLLPTADSSHVCRLFRLNFPSPPKDKVPKNILGFQPIYNFTRMIAQQSVLTIHAPGTPTMEERHEKFDERCLWRFTIPAGSKKHLRQELHDLGIWQSALFPDLDNLSQCLMYRHGIHTSEEHRAKEPRSSRAEDTPLDLHQSDLTSI